MSRVYANNCLYKFVGNKNCLFGPQKFFCRALKTEFFSVLKSIVICNQNWSWNYAFMSRFHMASEIICKCEGCLTNMTLEFTVFMIFFEMFFHGILWGKRFETNLTFFLPFFFEFFLHWYIFFGFIIIFIIYYIVFLVLRLIKQWIKILFFIYLSMY